MLAVDKIAWVLLVDGRILSTRARGKKVYDLPGGKRETGESDVQTLVREVGEELAVAIDAASAAHLGTFEAPERGPAVGVIARMTCYTAGYQGILAPSNEIEELVWLTYADRDRAARLDRLVFDQLHRVGQLA